MGDWRNDPATPANLKPREQGHALEPRYPNGRPEMTIDTKEWTHVSRATFGPARSRAHGGVGWTGDSYRYDLYRYSGKGSIWDRAWGLRYSHGGGDGWIIADSLPGEQTIFEIIAGLPDEVRRWDAAHAVYNAISSTVTETSRDVANKYRLAFAEGRLKKRKLRGQSAYKVELHEKAGSR
jgi:hypothetical protein